MAERVFGVGKDEEGVRNEREKKYLNYFLLGVRYILDH